jgi:hypothetical protein
MVVVKREVRYVELKSGHNDDGPAFISWVGFSKTGRTIYWHDRVLRRIRKGGIAGNHADVQSGEEYWVSGVKQDGQDRHWAGSGVVSIDEDVRDEYARIMGDHR